MEEIIINIDSKYRDINKYPNECKFRFNLEKTYKNIASIRLMSLEMNNSINYISSTKKNNFIKLHLPNKLSDPEGTIIQLDDGLLQIVGSIRKIFNGIFDNLTNTNGGLNTLTYDNKPFAEKYFYIFYLNRDLNINFDFNDAFYPESLANRLTIKEGWYSIYGINIIINNYIREKYAERKEFLNQNPNTDVIDLDSGNFRIKENVTFFVFDRRFRSTLFPELDCNRMDILTAKTYNFANIDLNCAQFKNDLYKLYIKDTTTFIVQDPGSDITNEYGILDLLNSNNYVITQQYLKPGLLASNSKYHINNLPSVPNSDSIQLYKLSMEVDYTSLTVAFNNDFTEITSGNSMNFYYYWIDKNDNEDPTWNRTENSVNTNVISNLLSKTFLYNEKFISEEQYNSTSYKATLYKDIPTFDIDFDTSNKINIPVVNDLTDVKLIEYPALGNYLGFRPNYKIDTNKFLYSSQIDYTVQTIRASKIFNTSGDNYAFIKLNNWGYIDFFNQKFMAKILLTSGLGNPKLDTSVNQGYRFRQPVNIDRIEIELVDYLGNTVDMNGFDFSFSIELKQILSSYDKDAMERQNITFKY